MMFTLVSLVFTFGAIASLVIAIGAILVLPLILKSFGLGATERRAIGLLRWGALLLAAAGALTILLRYGPSRAPDSWAATAVSSLASGVLWLFLSVLFSWYVSEFASFSEIYGPLGAVIGFSVELAVDHRRPGRSRTRCGLGRGQSERGRQRRPNMAPPSPAMRSNANAE